MGSKGRSRPAAAATATSSPCSPSGASLQAASDKMASPRDSSVSAAPAGPETSNRDNRKSSLAFILTGNQDCDQEEDQNEEKNHEYGSYQQEYTARHSSYETPGYSHQHSRNHEWGHAKPHHYHEQQQHYHPQPQLQYSSSPASGAFSVAPQMTPRPSFPLEMPPDTPRTQLESGWWTDSQPRKKGSKFCVVPGCISRAKHARLCWKHGGSVKCKVPTCSNRAKSKGVCWSHGGGTICSFDDCSTISVSNGVCWAHGGGKRCVVQGCGRPSYERTGNLCSVHFADSIV